MPKPGAIDHPAVIATGRQHRVRFLSQNRPGPRMGMGHYERLLIHHLIQIAPPDEWQFDITFGGRSGGTALNADQIEPGLHSATFSGFSLSRLAALPWQMARTAMRLGSRSPLPDLFHSLALSFPTPGTRPSVYTIHDLPPARFTDEGAVPRWAKQAAQEARAIITPSEFAKGELVELLDVSEERIQVIPNGCEHETFNPHVPLADADTLASYGLTPPFLIYVGGFTQRKNVEALLQAWHGIAAEYPDISLALVGPSTELGRLVEKSAPPRVVIIGYLERPQLAALMQAAIALVFPSVYEGFGLPPLEAMALGIPVVAVKAGAIPEVVGDTAVLATGGSPEALSAAMKVVLDDTEKGKNLRKQGPERAQMFSWTHHAESVLNVYRQVLNR